MKEPNEDILENMIYYSAKNCLLGHRFYPIYRQDSTSIIPYVGWKDLWNPRTEILIVLSLKHQCNQQGQISVALEREVPEYENVGLLYFWILEV